MPAGVRLAGTTNAEVEALASTLAEAHVDYEWAQWAFPIDDRAALLRQLFVLDLQVGLCTGSAWVADAGACVAIWAPPSTSSIDADTRAFIENAHSTRPTRPAVGHRSAATDLGSLRC